eukprot:GEZU01018999.1.p1 GENE.GEZU01018999.1~~GEZU01018999.1.p1  ORF type:complete len:105 (-),score=8.70 GEZU01018999.1:75-389(-)
MEIPPPPPPRPSSSSTTSIPLSSSSTPAEASMAAAMAIAGNGKSCCHDSSDHIFHAINKHKYWDIACAASAYRGFRNGVMTGVRIRMPYIFQAIIYAVIFRQGK